MDDLRLLVDNLRVVLDEGTYTDWLKGLLQKPGQSYDSKKPTPSSTGDTNQTPLFKPAELEPPEQKKPEQKKPEKWTSAGCVILPSLHPDDLNYVYVIKPSNNYGPWALPKGRVDDGESYREAARREVAEETGLVVSLLPGGYLGKGVGGYSITHYFMAVQTGGHPGPQDHEVEKVRLVSFEDAFKLFAKAGNKRDIEILKLAWKFTEKFRKHSGSRDLGDMEPASETKASKKGYGSGWMKYPK